MNPLPGELRELLRAAGIDEEQVRASGASPAGGGDYLMDPQLVVELLADALRSLHSVDPTAAASSMEPVYSMADAIAQARRRVEARESITLDQAYAHMETPRLLEVLEEGAGQLGEFPAALLVITHGAPEPASLRCTGSLPEGFADWEDAAIADPHRDLAFAATSVAASLGPMLVPVLIERYGVRPDPRRLDWWALAQQLTGKAATSRSSEAP